MLSRVALPVLMWSIPAVGGEEPPADQPVIELEMVTVTATKTERSPFEAPASVSISSNLSDKSYCRHLALIDKAGRTFKVSVSYWFGWGGDP